MALPKSAVVQAFLVDHRKFMQLLRDVGLALRAGEVERARELAAELNRVGGHHVAFEEAVLYPALDDTSHDRSLVIGLFEEHQNIVSALEQLVDSPSLDAETLQQITLAFEEGTRHAEHCGTLISQLSRLSPDDQREALDELLQLRSSELKWTELKKGS